MNKNVINSYRLQPGPPPTGTIAGRIVPLSAPASYRRAVVMLAALLLPLLAVGIVVYAARTVQPAPGVAPSPVAAEPTPVVVERVVVVEPSPVVIVVTATPQAGQVAPAPVQAVPARQAAPQAQTVTPKQPAPQTQAQPQAQPKPASVQRPAASAPAPTPSGPQERLLSRDCVYPSAPQGTIIRGYYTDASGRKRDAVCRADGWKAAD